MYRARWYAQPQRWSFCLVDRGKCGGKYWYWCRCSFESVVGSGDGHDPPPPPARAPAPFATVRALHQPSHFRPRRSSFFAGRKSKGDLNSAGCLFFPAAVRGAALRRAHANACILPPRHQYPADGNLRPSGCSVSQTASAKICWQAWVGPVHRAWAAPPPRAWEGHPPLAWGARALRASTRGHPPAWEEEAPAGR